MCEHGDSITGIMQVQHAGEITVNNTCGARLFFWMVESQSSPSTDPIVMWINGGPGSSSFLGFFGENGPYKVASDGVHLEDNPYRLVRQVLCPIHT
jgi:carboxypeptidase C (cathepsin A)